MPIRFRFLSLLAATTVGSLLFVSNAVAGLFNPKSFMLDNGMQVVVIEDHRAPVVTHMVWFRAGAGDEPPGKSGIAHFAEHLMFKGTGTRAPGEFSSIIAKNGGQDNAFTAQDYTGYFQNVAKDKLPMIMALFVDQMLNLKLTDKDIETERKVIIEERNSRVDNNPGGKFGEEMRAAFFRSSPYGIPIIGWRHEMEKLSRADAEAWLKKYYTPNNAVLIIAGDVTVDEVRKLAEKHYGSIPKGPDLKRVWPAEPPHRADISLTFRDPQVKQPSMQFSFLAPTVRSVERKHATALGVLEYILSGGKDSRINKKLVIDLKLASSAGSFYRSWRFGPGRFGFYGTPVAGKDVKDVEKALNDILQDVVENGVTEAEVKTAIRRLTTGLVYARDNLFTGPRVIGHALMSGLTLNEIETWPDRVKKVTVADVNAAAKFVFENKRRVTGYLLPDVKSDVQKGAAQ